MPIRKRSARLLPTLTLAGLLGAALRLPRVIREERQTRQWALESMGLNVPALLATDLEAGFLLLSESADVEYKCTDYYDPAGEGGVRWDDPTLAIDWPLADPLVSPKDRELPLLHVIRGLPSASALAASPDEGRLEIEEHGLHAEYPAVGTETESTMTGSRGAILVAASVLLAGGGLGRSAPCIMAYVSGVMTVSPASLVCRAGAGTGLLISGSSVVTGAEDSAGGSSAGVMPVSQCPSTQSRPPQSAGTAHGT